MRAPLEEHVAVPESGHDKLAFAVEFLSIRGNCNLHRHARGQDFNLPVRCHQHSMLDRCGDRQRIDRPTRCRQSLDCQKRPQPHKSGQK